VDLFVILIITIREPGKWEWQRRRQRRRDRKRESFREFRRILSQNMTLQRMPFLKPIVYDF